MAAFGVRMAFHHHMGTIVQTDADIDRLMATTGEAAGLLFDSGHCLFAGGIPRPAGRHIARVVHVHCKDLRRAVLDQLSQDMTFLAAVSAASSPSPATAASPSRRCCAGWRPSTPAGWSWKPSRIRARRTL